MSPRPVAVLLLAASLLPATARAQSPDALSRRYDTEQVSHDALHYDIRIRLADSGSVFDATVATRWRRAGTGPIRINLDSSYRISSLTIGGRPAGYRRAEADLLLVTAPPGGPDTVTTVISYRGAPPPFERQGRRSGQDDGLVQRGQGAGRTIFADNWPNRARKWLASQDHPSDKATVAWTIDAPSGLTVVANGNQLGREPIGGGYTRWRFALDQPIPVYTMVLGAARMAVTPMPPAQCARRCVPITVYSYPQDSAYAVDEPFRRAREIIDYFADVFGPYPYGELRHVQTSTIFGGMENSTVIFYDEGIYRARSFGEGLVAHETAHQWFGDAATEADWHHLWLSEGFATYAAALWAGHADGDSAFRTAMQGARATVLRSPASEKPIIDSTATDLLGLLNSNNYPKGSWVLHSLRGLIGDSAFFQGVRRYYREHTHGTALSADFARAMSAAAGQDLTWFFTQALTQPGFPVLAVRTSVDGAHLTIEISQVQKPEYGLYQLPNLEVSVGGRTLRIPLTGRTASITTHWDGRGAPDVEVDPAGWWLFAHATR